MGATLAMSTVDRKRSRMLSPRRAVELGESIAETYAVLRAVVDAMPAAEYMSTLSDMASVAQRLNWGSPAANLLAMEPIARAQRDAREGAASDLEEPLQRARSGLRLTGNRVEKALEARLASLDDGSRPLDSHAAGRARDGLTRFCDMRSHEGFLRASYAFVTDLPAPPIPRGDSRTGGLFRTHGPNGRRATTR